MLGHGWEERQQLLKQTLVNSSNANVDNDNISVASNDSMIPSSASADNHQALDDDRLPSTRVSTSHGFMKKPNSENGSNPSLDSDAGIIPRCVTDLFDMLEAMTQKVESFTFVVRTFTF